MCISCGCGSDEVSIEGRGLPGTYHPVSAGGLRFRRAVPLGAVHAPGLSTERVLRIEEDILADNDREAAQNRARLNQSGIFALNLVSSPGSGKTTLLEHTIRHWQQRTPLTVIEGDQQTANDAQRIRAAGAKALQINTGKGCHLDARMIAQALEVLTEQQALLPQSLLFIENVGNLVCPAAFDLGEAHKVVILSVTEGEDKPLKYPDMFRAADLLLISKTDLLPYVDFNPEAAIAMARQVRPGLPVIQLSSKTGEGFDAWLTWLQAGCTAVVEKALEC